MGRMRTAKPQEWTLRCQDDEGDPAALRVVQLGSSIALIPQNGRPLWLDRFSGDELASLILKAVTAATYATQTAGRHARPEPPRADRFPTEGAA